MNILRIRLFKFFQNIYIYYFQHLHIYLVEFLLKNEATKEKLRYNFIEVVLFCFSEKTSDLYKNYKTKITFTKIFYSYFFLKKSNKSG